MEKIDLIFYVMIAIFVMNIIGMVVSSINGYFLDGKRLHARVRNEINRGNFSHAIDVCEANLRKRPHDSQLLWLEAEAYFRIENPKKALEKFEHIASQEPMWAADAKKYIEAINART
jgi:tetratricopeptide (TPR) repeat protein